MQFRSFGKLDWKVSALGFGCMRLPTIDGNPIGGNINEAETIRMIRHAIDYGVNYIDTAYVYHNGNSEVVTGKALMDGYREKVKIATKSPTWLIHQADDFDKFLNEQLVRLRTDQIDFYLLHGLDKQKWHNTILPLKLLEKAEAAIRDGRIGYLGFSFHDQYEAFPEIVAGYDRWTFCQIQYNYMDIENQAGLKGINYAATKGLVVVVMEPLLGGRLAKPPQTIRESFDAYARASGIERSPADWALQWIWNQPEVSVVLSGMSTMEQVKANLDSANNAGINSLRAEELRFIDQVREQFRERTVIPCTGCGYCLPCPNSVSISRNFGVYNNGFMYDDLKGARMVYARFMGETDRASACIQCRACEAKCPQRIAISEWMPKVHNVLGNEGNV